jgi:hypothetical protein
MRAFTDIGKRGQGAIRGVGRCSGPSRPERILSLPSRACGLRVLWYTAFWANTSRRKSSAAQSERAIWADLLATSPLPPVPTRSRGAASGQNGVYLPLPVVRSNELA